MMKMMKLNRVVAMVMATSLMFAGASVQAGSPNHKPQASAKKAQATKKVILIDVRTPEEFSAGNLPNSINIPFEQIGDRISEITNDKNAEIQLYCKSGRRAGVALETLKGKGFTNLTNLGGYEDIKQKGYENVVKEKKAQPK